jgi:hypothetical protein
MAKSIASNTAPLAPCAHRRIRNRIGANGADIASPVRCERILAKSNGGVLMQINCSTSVEHTGIAFSHHLLDRPFRCAQESLAMKSDLFRARSDESELLTINCPRQDGLHLLRAQRQC